jgi:hypothetical protein
MGRRYQNRIFRRGGREDGSNRPTWVDKVGLLIAFASVVVAIVALVGGSDPSGKAPPELDLVDLVVRDVGRGPEPHSHIEVAIHNTGGRLAVIDEARISIRHVYKLPRCASQDDLPLSNTYGVSLPVNSRPGEVRVAPLHQQVGADQADRFAISISAKWPHDRVTGTLYLFEVGIALRTDGPQHRLPLGSALVALPMRPDPGEYYWTDDTPKLLRGLIVSSPTYVKQLRRFSMACWRANTATLRRALTTATARSGALAAISKELVTPTFAALE